MSERDIAMQRLRDRTGPSVQPIPVRVKFLTSWRMYNPLEVAAFDPTVASKLVSTDPQVAEYVDKDKRENYAKAVASQALQSRIARSPNKDAETVMFEATFDQMSGDQQLLVGQWLTSGASRTDAVQNAQAGLRPSNEAPEIESAPVESEEAAAAAQREALALAAQSGPVPATPKAPAPPAPVAAPAGMPQADDDPDSR